MRAVRPTGHLATFTETLNQRASIGSFPADCHEGPMRGGDYMMRKMLFGIATGLVLVSAGVRADDNDTADVKVAADKAKVEADIKAVKADKSTGKAAHEQGGDDRQQLAKDRAAHDEAGGEAGKAKPAARPAGLKSGFAQEQAGQ